MASRTFVDSLRHFGWDEFRHPENIDEGLLTWLDAVRDQAAVPLIPTSDAREYVPTGGSDGSLHLSGLAIDFRWNHTAEDRARIVAAVVTTPRPPGYSGFELGLEHGAPGGPHWHIGLFKDGRHNRVFAR